MFYEKTSNGYVIRIRVTPNSSRCSFSGTFSDSKGQVFLKANLTSVPEKGKANQELIKFLSKYFHLSKSSFSLISGETDRYKKLLINTPPSPALEDILHKLEIENDCTNN